MVGHYFSACSFSPPRGQVIINTKLVEDACNYKINQFGNRINTVVKPGIGRQYDYPEARQFEHVLEMNAGKRCFPRHQDQGSTFLDGHIGGAMNQVFAAANGDRCEASHAAWAYHHCVGDRGTACRWRGPLIPGINTYQFYALGEEESKSGKTQLIVNYQTDEMEDAEMKEVQQNASEGHMTGGGNVDKKETDFSVVAIRKNLQETAFFFPQLQTDKEGNISFSHDFKEIRR